MKIVVTEKTKTTPAPLIIVRVKTWLPNRAPQWSAK